MFAIRVLTLGACLCAPALASNDPVLVRSLVKDGFVVAGVGNLTSIDNLAVNDAGTWLVEADTDQADTNTDGVLLRSGTLFLREGQALASPAGASIDSFDAITLNNQGQSAWNFFLDGTSTLSDDSGVYWGAELEIQEGTVSTASGFSPGTVYTGWFEVKLNDTGLFLMVASVDDPAIASTTDRALVVGLHNPGMPPGEAVLFKEGDLLPGQTEVVADFLTGPHTFAINDPASILFVADLAGDTTKDLVAYLDGAVIAQEGSASPVAGRNWSSLSSSVVDLNDQGDWVISGSLDGDSASNSILVRNGQKLVQEGDVLADIAPYKITSFGTAPVQIDASGNVLWWGDWDDPDTNVDTGLFLNDRLLVREGVTMVDGLALDSIAGVQDAFAMSDDGRFIVFEGQLVGGVDGLFQIYPEGLATSIAGCSGNAGSLLSSAPAIGANVDLTFDSAQVAPAAVLLAISAQSSIVAGCGLSVPGLGEVFVGLTPPDPVLLALPSYTGGPLVASLAIPLDPTLICAQLWLQGAFFDVLALTSEPVRLTNGIEWSIGGAP